MILKLLIAVAVPLLAQPAKDNSTAQPAGDFFIVSSVDLSKNQILLKRPTEVTELVRVDGSTRYVDERDKSIRLTDLRAGDTVFIVSTPGSTQRLATVIRKGPMTLEILRERFLKPAKQ